MQILGVRLQLIVVAGCLLSACADDKTASSSQPASECEAGEEVACTCGDSDDEGTAECEDDGKPGECSCEEPSDTPAKNSDAAAAPSSGNADKIDAGQSRSDAAAVSRPIDAAMRPPSSAADAGASRADASGPAQSGASNPPAAANPAMNGPYMTTTEMNVGPGMAFTLVRPRELGMNGVKHPLITWGNGTGATPGVYTSLLNRLASHGFVVIASNSTNTGMATEMLQGVDWILEQNKMSGTMLYQKIDETQIGATGHSQGGFGTCAATRDPRIKTIAPIQGFRAPQGSFAGTIFALSGGMDTIVAPTGISSGFDRLSKGPAFLGQLNAATHTDWMGGRNASGMAINEAVTAWMRIQLMADQTLKSKFYGADCGYCKDMAWTVKQKGME
jgi:hypothetical protein